MNAEELRATFLAGTAALALGCGLLMAGDALAQNAPAPGATPTTQTGYHADAGVLLAATTYTNCTTTQAAVAQGTLGMAIAPPPSWYVYLTGVQIETGSNGTGSTASTVAWTTTGAAGNLPVWLVGSPGAVTGTGGVNEVYPTGLKILPTGVGGILVAPVTTLASTYVCAKFEGYFSPL